MREFLNIAGALSDPNRLRLLLSLSKNELCVCSLVDFIGLADSTVSKHMSILREAGLVESRKCGRWVYYRLAEESESLLAREAIALARKHLLSDRTIMADAIRVKELHCKNSAAICVTNHKSEADNVADEILTTA